MTEENNKVEEGPHRVRIQTAELTKSSTKESAQVAVVGTIIDGDFKGRQLTFYGGMVSPESIKFTVDQLRAGGWEGNNVKDLSGMVGNEAIFVVRHEDWEGKAKVKVKWINSLDGGAFKRLDASEKEEMGDTLNDQLAMLGLTQAVVPEADPADDNLGLDPDDDIGF